MCQLIDVEEDIPLYASRTTAELWPAGLISNAPISNAVFVPGFVAVVLVWLGDLRWMSDGVWAPGDYSRFVSLIAGLVWIAVVSRIRLTRGHPTRAS